MYTKNKKKRKHISSNNKNKKLLSNFNTIQIVKFKANKYNKVNSTKKLKNREI